MTESFYFPSMSLFIGLSMLSTIFVGGMLVMRGEITVGNIAEFIFYINLLMFPVSSIGNVASTAQRAGASQKRIDEFLNTEPEIISPEGAVAGVVDGSFTLADVSFTYPHTGIQALKHFTLDAQRGEKIAIIGRTGSGKSTIAHLLLRMYDVQEGDVAVSGMNVREWDLHALRAGIAYAPQDAFLFSDTVYNNIRFGRQQATKEEVQRAAHLADLDKDIHTLAQGYETIIGERGVMLSGGQKQRLVLARALLKNSDLLLLDECLSAVDTRTEQTILNNLEGYIKNKTVVVITHRIFTTWQFDKILVLDDGTVAEQGTHEELMRMDGRYAKLYRHQTETASAE